MSQLSITIPRQAEMDSRIAGRVRRVAELDGSFADDWSRDLRLSSDAERLVDVKPGRYVIEAFWRDGRLTSQSCIVEDRDTTSVRLRAPAGRPVPGAAPRDFTKPSAAGMSQTRGGNAYSVFQYDSKRLSWSGLFDREVISEAAKLSADSWPASREQDISLSPSGQTGRQWVMYWATDSWVVSSLPAGGTEDDRAFLRSRPDGLPFVAAGGPDMIGMTDLLPSGNSEAVHRYASATLAESASQALDRLASDSLLELCAFAYADYENFGDNAWMSVLARTPFGEAWPSDVLVLSGWRKLMTAAGEDDWRAAGELLESAVERGVPYYSLGVKLLADALSMLARAIPGHEESARLVRTLAMRTLPTEAFTTVKL